MSGRISIDFEDGEGAVVRLIGLVERRGFQVRGIAMQRRADNASLQLDLEARDASRSLEILDLQLRRIHGVRNVTHHAQPAGAA